MCKKCYYDGTKFATCFQEGVIVLLDTICPCPCDPPKKRKEKLQNGGELPVCPFCGHVCLGDV